MSAFSERMRQKLGLDGPLPNSVHLTYEEAFNAGLEAAAKSMEDINWTDKATEGWKPDESFAPYYARAIRALKE